MKILQLHQIKNKFINILSKEDNNWATILRSISREVVSLCGEIESTSSIKSTQGADLTADSNNFLTLFSDSPLMPTTSCGAAMLNKGIFNS